MNLLAWLTRHPLKGPSSIDRAQYTAEVMARVKAPAQPAPAPPARRLLSPGRAAQFWLPWPPACRAAAQAWRLALTMATVAAGILLMLTVTHPTSRRMFQLAQSQAAEDQWLDDTLQLLDELDENVSDEATGNASQEDWLEELKQLDDTELAASS